MKAVAYFGHWRMVFVYSVTHFLVDFACAFLMFRSIAQTPYWYLCILLYNFCAFAMQMPLGILADKLNRNYILAIIGCILVGLAYGFPPIPVVAAVAAGIGNSLFHLGGGIDVLNISKHGSSALGVFVSPGAWGIYFGAIAGKGSDISSFPILAALFVAAGTIYIVYRTYGGTYPENAPFSPDNGTSALLAVICLFLVVCLRSYVGLAMDFPWKNTGYWGLALACAVVLGKTAGGFAADRLGVFRAAFFSLAIAALLFSFSQTPLPGVSAVFLFNMTMPVTLWVMAGIFPGAKGFSFGLLTFGLFLGFLPVYFGVYIPPDTYWPFTLAAIVSLILVSIGIRKANLWSGR